MKRNSAAFLALLLSATMAVSPSASVLAESEMPVLLMDEASPQEETNALTEAEAEAVEEAVAETVETTVEAETVEAEAEVTEEKAEAETKVEAKTETKTKAAVKTAAKATPASETEAPVSKTHEITCTTLNAEGVVSGMYTMDKTIVTEQEDGTYLVRMHQASVNRNLLAVTDSVDKATAHEVDWNVGGGDDGYWFVIPVKSLSEPVYACFSSKDRVAQGKAFGNVMSLNFDEATLTDTDAAEVTAAEINIDPAVAPEAPVSKTHEITCTTLNAEGAVSGMYTMDKTIVSEQEYGTYLVRMHQSSANRNLLAVTDDVDKATNHEIDWNVGGGDDGYWFVIPVASLSQPVSVAFSSTDRVEQGKAFSNIMTLNFDEASLADTDAAEVTAAEINIDPAVAPEAPVSKTHEITCTTLNASGAVSSMYTMDKTIVTEQEDGTYLVRMHQASTNRNLLAVTDDVNKATNHEVDWNVGGGEDGYWFVIPVASLSQPVSVAFSSTSRVEEGKPFGNIMTLNFDETTLTDTDAAEVTASEINIDPAVKPADPVDPSEPTDPAEPTDPTDPTDPAEPTDPTEPEKPTAPADGIYTGAAVTNAAMFKVTDVKLTSKNGKMTAIVTLSGTGYDFLYMGSKEDAFAADESAWIPAVVDADGKYTYEIPIDALDTPLAVASRSAKYADAGKGVDAWIDRTITIKGDSLTKTGDLPADTPSGDDKPSGDNKPSGDSKPSGDNKPSGGEASGTITPKPNDGKAENESKYESDLSGATSAVNSSTSLKDGVYTPSSFSWSGGTGKVSISCNKVTVTGGKAYATLVFSSSKYGYVKASGNTYYPTVSGGSTIFTIPVELNKNNTIIGMTTAMSAAHEIQYNIFISIPGAGGVSGDTSQSASGMVSSDNSTLDEKAPEIVGLTFESETKLEEAEFFKIYNYENNITLLEIDVTKDTDRDPSLEENKNKKEDSKKADTKKSNSKKAAETEEDGEAAPSEEETTAELYNGNVVKYLIVPEKEEIPVGLEKDMIVIQLPADDMYMSAESGFAYMEDLGSMDLIGAVSVKEKDCKNKTIAKALKDNEIIYAGKEDKPVYKDLVKAKTDLAVVSGSILPGNADSKDKDSKKKDEKELEKETKAFEALTEHFALLGIPVVFDRSADEKSDLAKAEWIKVYGALTDQQKEADKLFSKTLEEKK